VADCVVAVVHGEAGARVEGLWSEIERRWGATRSHTVAPPHVTLAIVRGRPEPARLAAALAAVSRRHATFAVAGAGYGIFVGQGSESPVVHLAVTRTPRLSALHQSVVDALVAAGLDVDGQSLADHWRPHVTLADTGLDAALVGQAVAYLVEHGPKRWTLEIDSISVAASIGEVTLEQRLTGAG